MLALILGLTMGVAKPHVPSLIEASWSQTLVVGHRGAAAYKPENTLESFEEAIRSGAVATECDVHLDRDGGVVVMHDGTLDRTTSLTGPVVDASSEALRAAGVPFLGDYLRVTKDRIVSVIEIKAGEGVEQKVVDQVREQKMEDQAIVFSFGPERVARVKSLAPEIFGVWLVAAPGTPSEVLDRAKELGADAIGVQFRNATPALVEAAHARRVPVFVWTVPPGDEVDRLRALRVNFIITDHPRDVLAQLAR